MSGKRAVSKDYQKYLDRPYGWSEQINVVNCSQCGTANEEYKRICFECGAILSVIPRRSSRVRPSFRKWVPLILVLALAGVSIWWASYRRNNPRSQSEVTATRTKKSSTATKPSGQKVTPKTTQSTLPTRMSVPTSTPRQAEIITVRLNVRRGPSTDYPVITTLDTGVILPVLGVDDETGWLQVRTPSGETGWISGDPEYVSVRDDLEVVDTISTPFPKPAKCNVEVGATFNELWKQRNDLGCPINGEHRIAATTQEFQRGRMFWRADRNYVYVLYNDGRLNIFQTFKENTTDYSPPDDLYVPVRGFGEVWRELGGPDADIGWGIEPERGIEVAIQDFDEGVMIDGIDIKFVLYDAGQWVRQQ